VDALAAVASGADEMTAPFVYLSLGAGVQSSALLVMSALGLRGCPKADIAIFADTQDEPRWVYEQLETLMTWGNSHGLPVLITSRGRLSADRRVQIPAFAIGKDGEDSPLQRSCTRDYKIQPVRKAARVEMARGEYKKAVCLFGISVEESHRMKISPVQWVINRYPLVEAGMTRSACAQVLTDAGLPVPRKSACGFCPYHSDRAWREVRDHDPDAWQRALTYDDKIRTERGVFLHRSLIPLRDVDLGEDEPDLFGEECDGYCGV